MLGRRNASLAGRTVVITGAASGMGRSMALQASAAGSPVVIADVDEEGLRATEAAASGPVLARRVDVSDRDAVFGWAAEARRCSPAPLGAVINNAGVGVGQFLKDLSVEDFQWNMDVNFWGVVHGTQAYLPWLLEQRAGALANVSSVFGLIARPSSGAYNTSKFAVRGYTETLRQELAGTGVKVVCVYPGSVPTNILRNGRFYVDYRGRTTVEGVQRELEMGATVTTDEAAAKILRGVAAGRPRVLVGQDAVATDVLSRLAPVRYSTVIEKLAAKRFP